MMLLWKTKTKKSAVLLGGVFSLLAQGQSLDFSKGLLSREWGLNGKNGVSAPETWKRMKGKCDTNEVVVAVIDTGVNVSHPALKDSLWVNKQEAGGKAGRDNDGNGFVGDVNGWDFVTNSPAIVDVHGHGTHIAGIIAGKAQDSNGVLGVCPGAKIMSLRYYDPKAKDQANLNNTIKAIEYAVKMNVDIINYSGGGAEFSKKEFEALKQAEAKGILVVAAAGNERSNADENLYFPAAYSLNNILSVTAINDAGRVLPSSNWGVAKVHVAAPGENILSADRSGGFTYMTGTSQATAFVSGIAALVIAEERAKSGNNAQKFSAPMLKERIESSVVKSPSLASKTKTSGRADALATLFPEALKSNEVVPAKKPTSVKKIASRKADRKLAARARK